MQKKLIALAVAAALTAPAAAMAADVTVYGKAFLNIESVNNNKNNVVANGGVLTNSNSATRINNDASRLGFKASEDLGNDLKAIFQYEVQMDANGNAGNGLGVTRNSGLGMEGGFGKAIIGIWDSPYKVVHNKTELFDNTTSFSAINIIGRANGGAVVNYNTRQKNMVQYWSPKFAGFQAAVSYSPDSAQTAAKNATVMSLSGTYDVDAIYVALGFENRADATVTGTTDNATRLTGRYNFGPAWIGATVESIKINTALTTNYTQKNMELVGQFSITDKDTIALSYAKAGKTDVANTGANQVSLRLGHNFSKNSEIFAAYTSIKNETAGAYNTTASTAFGGATTGATVSAFGVGLIQSF